MWLLGALQTLGLHFAGEGRTVEQQVRIAAGLLVVLGAPDHARLCLKFLNIALAPKKLRKPRYRGAKGEFQMELRGNPMSPDALP